MPLDTIPQLFFSSAEKYVSRVALGYKHGGKFQGQITWAEWLLEVKQTACGLASLGIAHGDRVGILAENCPSWTYADLGTLLLGAIVVPIYPTSSAADLSFIINNAGIKALFISTPDQYEKVRAFQSDVKIITFYNHAQPHTTSLSVLQAHGHKYLDQNPKLIESCLERGTGDDLATLIYTSGTTGVPKGVMLTHRNFIENYLGSAQRIQISENDTALSFLPLSHVFERMAGYYFMAFSGAKIVYAESMLTVAHDIKEVCPTVAAAVPRFYEKVYAAIQEKLRKRGPLALGLFQKAFAFRKKHLALLRSSHTPGVWPLPHPRGVERLIIRLGDAVYDKLVFSKIRAGVGGRMRFFISGGAPLSKELAEFFNLAGVLILEGYGLTETSPVIAVNTESEHRFGTVGKTLANVSVKIAEDGEILTSGPCVMKGYWNNAEATAEVLENGWFHTGDIGEFDADGYLKITDRKKDLIVTAGGKKVAPQKLEALVARDPLFTQVVALGDKRPYIIALVVLNRALAAEGIASVGLGDKPYEACVADSVFIEWVNTRLHNQLKEVAQFESIKKAAILTNEFSIANGELTPTLKVKRRFVMEKYAAVINQLYAS